MCSYSIIAFFHHHQALYNNGRRKGPVGFDAILGFSCIFRQRIGPLFILGAFVRRTSKQVCVSVMLEYEVSFHENNARALPSRELRLHHSPFQRSPNHTTTSAHRNWGGATKKQLTTTTTTRKRRPRKNVWRIQSQETEAS